MGVSVNSKVVKTGTELPTPIPASKIANLPDDGINVSPSLLPI